MFISHMLTIHIIDTEPIKVLESVPDKSKRYYEFVSRDDENQHHLISFESYEFSKLRQHVGTWACGGCAFIFRQITPTQRKVLWAYGANDLEDGWHSDESGDPDESDESDESGESDKSDS